MAQKTVFIPGVWDLLHMGHINILAEACYLGDRLIVGVQSDEVVELQKGARPIIPLEDRMRMLLRVKGVDAVHVLHTDRFIDALEERAPDILAVGADWGYEPRHQEAEAWMRRNGGRVVQLNYTEGISSTIIKDRIIRRANAKKAKALP